MSAPQAGAAHQLWPVVLFTYIACFQEVEPSIFAAGLTKPQQPCDPQGWVCTWRGWVFSVRAALSRARDQEEMGMQQQQRSCMKPTRHISRISNGSVYTELAARLSSGCFGQRDFWKVPGAACGFSAVCGVCAGLVEGKE